MNSTVIYGMFGSESISSRLHNTLINLHNPPHINILYSNIPIHSNCYIWRNNGNIVYALIGSANFSARGLNIPLRENLAETTVDTFSDLDTYLNQILTNTVECTSATLTAPPTNIRNICSMVLYDPSTGEVPRSSGLNWGHSLRGHNNPGMDIFLFVQAIFERTHNYSHQNKYILLEIWVLADRIDKMIQLS